jgi:hypothetical protein
MYLILIYSENRTFDISNNKYVEEEEYVLVLDLLTNLTPKGWEALN